MDGRLGSWCALAAAVLLGCSEEDASTGAGPGGGTSGATGGQAGAGATGCEPGTLTLDDGSCRPAGIPEDACGVGFEPSGDGGCRAILPDAPCGEGTFAAPGETACHEVMPCPADAWGDTP